MFDITVVTCTHNPRLDFLLATVQALTRQSLATDRWEYLLIDNASDPAKRPDVDLTWHPHARILREEKLGVTPARLRGIRESQGELLVFVDDDNVLDGDYLEQALKVANETSFLGSWSGQCRPRFDEPPPEWTRRYWGNLVIREFDQNIWSNLPRLAETMPCGAGLCVRRQVAHRYLSVQEGTPPPIQLDRTGDSLVSGGDNDLATCACDLGLGVGLIASLKLTHLIAARKLTVDYLARLAEGIQFSSLLLDADRGLRLPERSIQGKLLDRVRLLLARGPHREILKAVYRGREKARMQLLRQD
jgi:glycosyltransferase involved in cell wall biosynthesis